MVREYPIPKREAAMAAQIIKDLKTQIFEGIESKPSGPVYIALVKAFPLTRITSEKENEVALAVVERLMLFLNAHTELSPDVRDQFSQYTVCLGQLIEDFEKQAYPGNKVSGREMLAYLMEIHNLRQQDLKNELGGQSVVSEILKGDRDFNIRQVRALADRFKVSPLAFFG